MDIASDFVIVVLAGLVGGVAARLLRLPLLVGYVAAGVLVGPHTGGPTVVQIHDVERLAEIGVALLLFSNGLEISLRDLNSVRSLALGGGLLQILLTVGICAASLPGLAGMTRIESLWLGSMISLSSTAVVLKTITASGYTTTLASRAMIGLLVVQDLAVVPMMILLPQLGDFAGLGGRLARSLAISALLIGGILVVGSHLFPRLLRRVIDWGPRELFLVAIVSIGIGVGFVTQQAGLSFALGAFIAGIVLSESEFSHQALADVMPVRDVFGLLFFVSVGMLLDPAFALAQWRMLLAAVAAVLAGKALLIGLSARAFGYARMAPWIIGLALAQIGEFSFVLARTGLSTGALSRSTYDLALTTTVLTMAVSPLLAALALPLGRAWRRLWPSVPDAMPAPAAPAESAPEVVIAGYGRTGKAIVAALRRSETRFVVVELDHGVYSSLRDAGIEGVWGDIAGDEVQQAAGVSEARILLLALPDADAARLALIRARRRNPNLRIVARADTAAQRAALVRAGAAGAVSPEFECGIAMLRLSSAASEEWTSQARKEFYDDAPDMMK